LRAAITPKKTSRDAVYHCPFHPRHGIGKYQQEHEDRKPGTGMLRRAEREFGVSLAQSVLVGDRCSDIAAANTAGLSQAFLVTGTEPSCPGTFQTVNSLAQVERWLIEQG
jgi:D-glycero-D-manno-heptose 1,7-bisphosphate phosphatase